MTTAANLYERNSLYQFRKVLSINNKQIAALPTFLERAPSEKAGECLVLDCGDKYSRGKSAFENDQSIEVVAGPVKGAVPDSVSGTPAHVFLDRHVDLLQQLGDISGLPLGYCFSYPSEKLEPVTQSCCDGRKGFSLKVWLENTWATCLLRLVV